MAAQGLAASEVDAIKRMMADWTDAMLAGDKAKWRRYWAADGVLMPPGHARVRGHEALVDFADANFGAIRGYAFSDWAVAGREDLAVVTNTMRTYASAEATGDPSATLKQMLHLRKGADGGWQVQAVIFNSD